MTVSITITPLNSARDAAEVSAMASAIMVVDGSGLGGREELAVDDNGHTGKTWDDI